MTKILPAILIMFLMSCDQARQPAVVTETVIIVPPAPAAETVPDPPSDPVTSIRQKVEKINTIKLETKHFEFMCDEKMMVDYFYSDGEIVKITVDFGTVGDVYAKEDYYYDSGKLIFNYEFVEGGPACEGCIKTDEYRTYIVDNKVVKHLKNKTEATCRKCDFSSSSRQYRLLLAKMEEEVKGVLCN